MTSAELEAALQSLPEWRREKAMRFKFEGGRRECACSFLLLKDMLRDIYGITDDITFDYNEHDKPFIHQHPDIHFNISHCRHAVACAVSAPPLAPDTPLTPHTPLTPDTPDTPNTPVGIDIECTGRYKDGIAEYTCSAEELHTIRTSDDPDLAFTRLWTMKESLLKLIGTGITDNLKNILHEYHDRVNFQTIYSPTLSYVCTIATFK